MQKYLPKSIILILLLLCFCYNIAKCQSELIPISNDINNRIERNIYFSGSKQSHSAIKPFIVGDVLDSSKYASLLNPISEKDWQKKSWLTRKIFLQHLIEVNRKDYQFTADFLPTLSIGREGNRTLDVNTRGFEIKGVIGAKKLFSFTSYLYENQAKFARYVTTFSDINQVIPGQAIVHSSPTADSFDFAYSGGTLSFTPSEFLNIQLGYDKNFIGDGYRSLLLSDNAVNYPFIKLTGTLGSVRYMAMYAQFTNNYNLPVSDDIPFPKKNGIFHYLSWNANKNLSFGVFENVMWVPGDINFTYLNPIIFAHPVDEANGSPGKSLIGFTGSYKFLNHYVLYSQFVINEFTFKEVFAGTGYWANKQGLQLGLKNIDAFNVKNLTLQAEFNTVRPYTYSSDKQIKNYGHLDQSLAHPYGANFREFLLIGNYNIKRFSIRGQLGYSLYGLDTLNSNYGKNIYLSYETRKSNYGNFIGQGIRTNLYYSNFNIFYLLNPKNNLGIEFGYLQRREVNALGKNDASVITFGIKSSFRNLYYDF